MNKYLMFFILLTLYASKVFADESETQLMKYSASAIEEPHWFKESFLDIAEDIQEANEEGRKLLIYFHQAGCPYCYNLVQQTFLDPKLSVFIQKHFDVVALNLWGDREVTLPNGDILTEKALATKWKVQYTPTLIFYAEGLAPSLRIDGYRSKAMMAKIFDYVLTDSQDQSLAQTLMHSDPSEALYPSLIFAALKSSSQLDNSKPKAVLFEYPGCADCEQLHKTVLSRRDTHELLSPYTALRVDLSDSTTLPVLSDTSSATAKEWAEALGLTYFPSVVFFDEHNQEQFRVDSYIQAFHFQAALEYVSKKIYQREPEFQRYINERAENLREKGKKVQITE